MARTVVYQAEQSKFKGESYLAIVKYLRDDAGELERVKGGIWIGLSGDTDAVLARLTNACEQALAFATACESKHAEIIRAADAKAQPKAPRAPKNSPPAAPVAPVAPVAPEKPKAQGCDKCGWTTSVGDHAPYCTGTLRELDVPAPAAPAAPAPRVDSALNRAAAVQAARSGKPASPKNGKVGATTRDTGKPAPTLSPEEQAEQDVLRQYGLA